MSNDIINSIEHLQEQNSIDFQEIKRLDKEIKRLEDTLHLHLRTYDGKLVADNSTGTAFPIWVPSSILVAGCSSSIKI